MKVEGPCVPEQGGSESNHKPIVPLKLTRHASQAQGVMDPFLSLVSFVVVGFV